MKNAMTFILVSLFAFSFFTGCQNPTTGEEEVVGNGGGLITVTISESNARKILAWADTLDSINLTHTVTVYGGQGGPHAQTIPAGATGGTANFSVTPGTWKIKVEGKLPDGEVVSAGEAERQINKGNNPPVTITMGKPSSLPSFDVTFHGNGGGFPETTKIQNVNKYGTAKRPDPEPTRAQYYFADWYTESSCTNKYNFDTAVKNAFTLYASWSTEAFTVTFVDSFHAAIPAQTVGRGGRATEPDVKRDGFTVAWFTEADFKNQWNFETGIITKDMTLYAQWTQNSNPSSGTITINISGSPTFSDALVLHEITMDGTQIAKDVRIGDPAISRPAASGERDIVVRGYSGGKLVSYSDETVDVTAGQTSVQTMNLLKAFEVKTAVEWNTAVDAIKAGGNDKGYYIVVTDNFSIPGYATSSLSSTPTPTFGTVTGLTVNIRGAGTITLASGSTGSLLHINSNQTASLKDTNLVGHSTNNTSLVFVKEGGTFNMAGGKISGNTNTDTNGGGVYIGGTFTMTGGTISNNAVVRNYTAYGAGGGVSIGGGTTGYFGYGTFTMSGGTISNNTATRYGGGVFLEALVHDPNKNTYFNMTGGTISDNKVTGDKTSPSVENAGRGGGVSTRDADFNQGYGTMGSSIGKIYINMSGGIISNNTGSDFLGSSGGGILISFYTTFTMSGGTISGNSCSSSGGGVRISGDSTTSFNMTGGTITSNKAGLFGGGVSLNFSNFNLKSLEFITGNTADRTDPAPNNQCYLAYDNSNNILFLINGNPPPDNLKINNTTYAW